MKTALGQIIMQLMMIVHLRAQLLITSVRLSTDVISQKSDYTFQIIRFGTTAPIPANTTIQISFPNAYASSTVDSCLPLNWTGVTSLSCSYSSLKLRISNGFPASSNVESFSILARGVINPIAANTYSLFQIKFKYPNGTQEIGTGGYSVQITTANATCSIALISGLVFGEGLLTITYTSTFITSSSIGYLMKLSMLQSYPSDPTNTDINPILSVSNTMLAKYLFEFKFTNSFNLTMKMPPSTQPQENFIFIMTSNALGDYDKCYLSISGVQPNEFITLSMSQAEVQSLSSITISLLGTSPILQSDLIRINFTGTSFNISNVTNFATFIRGAIGQKQLAKANQILTIRNIASYTIVSEIAFIIANISLPYSTQPQTITVYVETDSGYIRDSETYSYTSMAGQFPVSTFTCLITEIGYTTSCTLKLQLKNEIKGSSYIQLKFPFGFRIPNGYSQCVSAGTNINSISNCNSYSLTNSIRVSGMASNLAAISAGSMIEVTLGSLMLPTIPETHTITISTRTSDDYLIDTSTINFVTIARPLLSSQISISSTQTITSTTTNYNVNLQLPLTLGLPFIMNFHIPFNNVSTPSVNGNLLSSAYDPLTRILTIQNVGNAVMTITGFQTHQSTAPVTLSGNLTYNGTRYFYFTGYDIVMSSPKEINVYSFTQSNSVVGTVFVGTFILSDIKVNDIIKVPTAYYSISQQDCSSNCDCGPDGIVQVNQINNYGTNVTQISMNLINNGYISTSTFSINVYESTGVFVKQTKLVSIRTADTNILNITATQTNPYYLENSTYTFNVSMTTAAPASSTSNFLAVTVPSTYRIQSWSCIVGCVPQPPPISGVMYFSISSTQVRFTLGLLNAVSFLSPIKMTSSSLGDMDYGQYLPVSPCSRPCRSCSTTNSSLCESCYLWSSQNKLRNGTCVSECQSQQFYNNTSLACESCHNYCLSCVTNSTYCYSCKPQYFYFQMSCLTECPIGYYETNTGQCSVCQANCLDCTSDTICIKCGNTSFLYQGSCWSSCSSGTYVNPLANQCLNCSANCAVCDASGCNQCQSTYYLYSKSCYLQCPEGLFKATSTCEPCQSPCATCSQYSNNCTSCVTSVNNIPYYYLSHNCYQTQCPDTYYISPLSNTCLKCLNPCLLCNRTQCLTCQPGLYYYEGYCSTECQSGTYPTSNFTCNKCVQPCFTCSSATLCLSCQAPYFLYNHTCILACPEGYYQQATLCQPCVSPCLTCTSSSTCLSCLSLSFFNSSCVTTCPLGFYPAPVTVLNQTTNKCTKCVLPCITCITQSSCLSCKSGLVLFQMACQSRCPEQYYQSNGICFSCSYPCKLCNSTGCISCANSELYLQRQECLSSCTDLHPNNATMMCQSCKFPCSTCTWSTTCLSCLDPYIFYQEECIRTCPAGKYNSNQQCVECPSLCATCYLVGDQLRCPTCKSNSYVYGYECVGTCPSESTLESPYCLSLSCNSLTNCQTCSNMRCLQCQANYTLNSNTGKCEQIQQQETLLSAVSQIPVPFPFLIATLLIIVLGFLIRIQFNKMFTPLFIYAFAGIAECGSFALWLALIYVRGINLNQSGFYLKFTATALIVAYIFFNIVGFILHIKVTRRDRKFVTWQKQDNKCTSIAVTIVALIFSFRFSILKYSKLGHLLRFSAILSHDNKMSHENLLAYLSILIISIPAAVIAAWVAYLQQTMNYLFFTSIQVAIMAVIMIILSIIQSLTPKGYTLEKKQDYKQGHDVDHIQGESLEEMMVKMGVVQEEYHQGKELQSQEGEVRARNSYYHDDEQHEGARTTEAFAYGKGQDQKLSIDSDIQDTHSNQEYQHSAALRRILSPIDQKQQLQNILIEAERRAQSLNKPSRPIGTIKKQSLKELIDEQQSSEGIQSDSEPLPIDAPRSATQIKQKASILNKQRTMSLNEDLKTNLQIQERRVGMRKLEFLFQKLKIQQRQEQQLRERLEKVTEEQKKLKLKEYERARQLIERNQMNVEDKLSKVQEMLSARNIRESERKAKIKQMQLKRKQDRAERVAQQTAKRNVIYPITEDINESNLSKHNKIIDKNLDDDMQDQVSWNEDQAQVSFKPNNEWQITEQRQTPQLQQTQQKNNKSEQLIPHQAQQFEEIQLDHWPVDPQLQEKIKQIQQRADEYIKKPSKSKLLIEEYDIDLQSDIGTGVDDILYKDNEPEDNLEAVNERNNQQFFQIGEDSKITRKRVNKSVIDLSPSKKYKRNNN